MRSIDERQAWQRLAKARKGGGSQVVTVEAWGQVQMDVSVGCTVLAGFNGAGKSQVLTALSDALGEDALFLQLHRVCEHARSLLGSRSDIAEMEAENGQLLMDDGMVENLSRIVGRDYDEVAWYALELEPTSEYNASFNWPDEQPQVPHFRVKLGDTEYTSLDMGLGEFSVHLLFWMLQQVRDKPGLVILLDEPDAYLPPVGSDVLLKRLLDMCLRRGWNMVLSTHSDAIIAAALEHDSLMVLRRGMDGAIETQTSSTAGPAIAEELLPRPALEGILFCEDESAAALIRAFFRLTEHRFARSCDVIWRNGHGYLTTLYQQVPRVDAMRVKFGFVYDGDQRNDLPKSDGAPKWPCLVLPSDGGPDDLFKSLASETERLAARLHRTETQVKAWTDSLTGSDGHDWVNGMCYRTGARTAALDALAELWTESNPDEARLFVEAVAAEW